MSEFWQHALIAAVVIVATWVVAKVVDHRIARRNLPADVMTRYRVIRRVLFVTIVFVGVMSALLVIPQVRAVAGAVLASSAVIGLVIGLASQRVIGNAVAGIMIAFTQPLRLGDEVEVQGARGVVEEIGLNYTWLRTRDDNRVVVPNEKLASETIRNSTIRSPGGFIEATAKLPLQADLRGVLQSLSVDGTVARVVELGANDVTISVRRRASGARPLGDAASDLRVEVAERLRSAGVYAEPEEA
ncbi:MAG TPA: mechanosensitive ion channel domain-containing protein [Gaiellaceae bacterium]|jgi:small-conductance mechanosensitive channel